jgi:hypothetical protein
MRPRPDKAQLLLCSRCQCNMGNHTWVAVSPPAERFLSSLRLCPPCIESFRTFIANGLNRPVSVSVVALKQPDRFASQSPPPKNSFDDDDEAAEQQPELVECSLADKVPIRRVRSVR